MFSELSNGEILDSKLAKHFLVSLFKELHVPLSNKEIEEIEKYHLTQRLTSAEKLQRLIVNLLPKGMII